MKCQDYNGFNCDTLKDEELYVLRFSPRFPNITIQLDLSPWCFNEKKSNFRNSKHCGF